MIYFTLPSSPLNTFQNIKIETQTTFPPVFVSQSLCSYMNDIKEKISSREKEWDIYKKYTNPYEYIHSVVPQKKKSISKYKPISRSYFKMLEMMSEFKLDQSLSQKSMKTFHLAEGPGGFIEAICNKRNNPMDEYYGMTIITDETDDNVPAWHKTGYFLSQHPNIHLEYGVDGTGNLLHIQNFEYCVQKYGSSMDLITADGGFDFSNDFNRQEISITKLLWGQVCYAICLQKKGGNFILKIFDIFYEHTVQILYILSAFYSDVNVCKLKTSRVGNSEKYVVCRNFRFSSYFEYYPIIHESFTNVSVIYQRQFQHMHTHIYKGPCLSIKNRLPPHLTGLHNLLNNKNIEKPHIRSCKPEDDCWRDSMGSTKSIDPLHTVDIFAKETHFVPYMNSVPYMNAVVPYMNTIPYASAVPYAVDIFIWKLLDFEIPRHFTKQIEDINSTFGQQQIENIHYTISLIDKQPKQDKLDQLVKQNITKCIHWCMEHEISYNNLVNTNIFEPKNTTISTTTQSSSDLLSLFHG